MSEWNDEMESAFGRGEKGEWTYNEYEKLSKSIETNGKGMKRSGLCGLGGVEMGEEGDSLFETAIELVLQWDAIIEMEEWGVDGGM